MSVGVISSRAVGVKGGRGLLAGFDFEDLWMALDDANQDAVDVCAQFLVAHLLFL